MIDFQLTEEKQSLDMKIKNVNKRFAVKGRLSGKTNKNKSNINDIKDSWHKNDRVKNIKNVEEASQI